MNNDIVGEYNDDDDENDDNVDDDDNESAFSSSSLLSSSLPTPDGDAPRAGEDGECTICEAAAPEISLACGHAFCQRCIAKWRLQFADIFEPEADGASASAAAAVLSSANPTCPTCRLPTRDTDADDWQLTDVSADELQREIARLLAHVHALVTE